MLKNEREKDLGVIANVLQQLKRPTMLGITENKMTNALMPPYRSMMQPHLEECM